MVVALNGLAGLAIIQKNYIEAVSLYKEALALAEEYSEDFRLDPLLNIHIHHNLSETLPLAARCSEQCLLNRQEFPESPGRVSKMHRIEKCDQYVYKRRKVSEKGNFVTDSGNLLDSTTDLPENGLNNEECDIVAQASSSSLSDVSLRTACENMKQKYLSAFRSKLSHAQEEFRKSYMQVWILHAIIWLAWCILLSLIIMTYRKSLIASYLILRNAHSRCPITYYFLGLN